MQTPMSSMRTPSALSVNITASLSREAAATLTAATDPPLERRARLTAGEAAPHPPSPASWRSAPSPAVRRAVRGTEFDCTAGIALNQNYARGHEPLSALQGEREGPTRRVGKVRWAAPQTGSPAPLTLPSPPASGGEGKGRVVKATLRRQIFEK